MSKHQLTAITALFLFLILVIAGFYVSVHPIWFVVLGVVWVTITATGSYSISWNFHVQAYCQNPLETRKRVAITFDDGPSETTALVLDILKKYDVPASFFCVGRQIERHPTILQRICREGHIVGNHTHSHSKSFGFYNKQQVVDELQRTDKLISDLCGKKPIYFRPPFGVTNPSIRRALSVTKHIVIGWSIRSLDGILSDEKVILNRIVKRIRPGGVILLHDTSIPTVNILEQLLVFLQGQGYTVVPLSQLLTHEN